MKVRIFLTLLICFVTSQSSAQDKDRPKIRFGKVSPEDFQAQYPIDSSAEAVIIADIGSTDFVGNSKGGFSIEFKRYCRIHIRNKNAYGISQVEIPIYASDEIEEELSSIKAVTYNLENGKVVETKLDPKNDIFKEKLSKNKVIKKFSFPAVREGSIIEMEYKLKSGFLFNLRPWEFQDTYPTLWSEYVVGMPEFLNYVSLTQGYQKFYIKDQKDKRESFSVEIPKDMPYQTGSERVSFSAGITFFRWVMKDVPALKEESYTSAISNHIAKIEFQLSEYREPFTPKKVMHTWTETAKRLMEASDFGEPLTQENEWLNDVMLVVLKNTATPLERARNIYAWVRDNMSCTGSNAFYIKKSLRNTFTTRTGTAVEINLLLTAMMRKAGLGADPMILSTRSNGYTYSLYPLIDRFNYVISRVEINDQQYLLDASRPQLGFNKLGSDCYNGHARVINEAAEGMELKSESLSEKSLTSIFMVNNAKGGMDAAVQHSPGYYESYRIRSDIKEKGIAGYNSELKKDAGNEIEVSGTKIDSLNDLEAPLAIKYDLHLPAETDDIWYFSPMFVRAWDENPFKSAERLYPVEMPYAIDQTYLLRMDVPTGYTVDELPKQLLVKLNTENEGVFEYRMVESGGVISVRSRLKINRTYFAPDEYKMLRDFFDLVVKKQSEQIVFKKKK